MTIYNWIFVAAFIAWIGFGICAIGNFYPLGHPVKPGQYWYLEWTYDEGTPIERHTANWVAIDSVYDGYVIKARCISDGREISYTNGCTVRSFLPDQGWLWPTTLGSPDRGWTISKEQYESHLNNKNGN